VILIFLNKQKVRLTMIFCFIMFCLIQITGMAFTGFVIIPETIPQVMVDVFSLIFGIPAITLLLLLNCDLDEQINN